MYARLTLKILRDEYHLFQIYFRCLQVSSTIDRSLIINVKQVISIFTNIFGILLYWCKNKSINNYYLHFLSNVGS